MYQLLRSLTASQLFGRQVPALGLSFLIASLSYRFGSFALECLAFLATWFVIDLLLSLLLRSRAGTQASTRPLASTELRDGLERPYPGTGKRR